jgi:hypothetical protein
MSRRKRLALAGAALVILGGVASGAFATITTNSGGTKTYSYVVRQDAATTTSSTSFVTIPGAVAPVTVSDGGDLIIASFTAESACYSSSTAARWCSVRLILVNRSNGAVTQMLPASGIDFAFDSTNLGRETSASWQGHSMDRAYRIGNGSYYVIAQQAVTSTSTVLRLDDWMLSVEKST